MATNCIDFILPISPTDPDIPIDRADPVLASGSVVLVDVSTWQAGLPNDGYVVPNIASAEAAEQGVTDNAMTLVVNAGLTAERTAKGGYHVIVPQGVGPDANVYNSVELPLPLREHLISKKGDKFYFSIWSRTTQAAAASARNIAMIRGTENNERLLAIYQGQYYPLDADYAERGAGRSSLGNTYTSFASAGTAQWQSSATTVRPEGMRSLSVWGSCLPDNNGTPARNDLPSYIFYRCYLENLTESGRSYAEVDALDYGLWQEAFGAGGRFADDTFTAP